MKNIIYFLVIIAALSSCGEIDGDGAPFALNPSVSYKYMNDSYPVKGVLYVDLEREHPLNALDYTIDTGKGPAQLFDYVILSRSYLALKNGYPSVEPDGNLRHVLENSRAYIRPLHQKGIQVLVEIKAGTYGDGEAGAAFGFGTMDLTCITEFTRELRLLIDKYGIDGFYFNDEGAGTLAYSPGTKTLKQFGKSDPLYNEELFQFKTKSAPEITATLWREGGSNFCNLIWKTTEALKENYTTYLTNEKGDQILDAQGKPKGETLSIKRNIMVSDAGHGRHFISNVRESYMPDAYSGASPELYNNLNYIIHNGAKNDAMANPYMYDEAGKKDDGALYKGSYAPFAIDVEHKLSAEDAESWAEFFQNSISGVSPYGALFFKNLPAAGAESAAYMSRFTSVIFNKNVDCSGGGRVKDW